MLRILYGRESIDKAKIIFDNAKAKSIVLVPDQFTLEAEREAFRCLGTEGITDPEIISISRLGFRILAETGGIKKRRIDKYGRHILLTSVIEELAKKGELTVYGALSGKNSFTELVNNFIADLKQHSINPDGLAGIRAGMKDSEILARKLVDIEKIYRCYEEKISGIFIDTEDYIDMYVPAAAEAKSLYGRDIWVWGFDYFAPKNAEFIVQLASVGNVMVMMTADYGARDEEIFYLTEGMMRRFEAMAEERGVKTSRIALAEIEERDANARRKKADFENASAVLERELFAIPAKPAAPHSRASKQVTLVAAANCYSEAETAAAYITELVRDKGFHYKDILMVCNDLSARGTIIKRVFAEYGIDVFMDEKRGILKNPVIVYILSLLEIVAKDYRTKDIFEFLKTGFTPFARSDIEELENYAVKYRIRGSMWKRPFKYGISEYGDNDFARLEEMRGELCDFIGAFETEFKKSRKAILRAQALYNFLNETAQIPRKIEEAAFEAEEAGAGAFAQELLQVWEEIVSVLDQIVNVIGEESPSMKTFSELMRAGFEASEVGLLPPAADGLSCGTMQRTRSGKVRVLVVLGANDGLLPMEIRPEELLSEDEKMRLAENDFEVSELDELRVREEKLAIYRTFSLPSDCLYISYSGSDTEGNEQKPSPIFNAVRKIFPDISVQGDLDSRGEPMALIESKGSALNHLVREIREKDGAVAEEWQTLMDWYKINEIERFREASSGLTYRNNIKRLPETLVQKLYKQNEKDDMVISPSRLEKYSRCPFAHFVLYGLRPEERRVFEAGAREIGDMYHECLMRFSEEMSKEDKIAALETADGSGKNREGVKKWYRVTREQTDAMIEAIINEITLAYREGIFAYGGEEEYRRSRMKESLKEVAWALVLQNRAGSIDEMYFEAGFGRDGAKKFPPVNVETSSGDVFIEGKIDRVDILRNGAVKVIDYKSGNERFKAEEARGGWRLQLMLYLKAASFDKSREKTREPAGIFYFLIKDTDINADGVAAENIAEKLSDSVKKEFRMNGLIVDSGSNAIDIAGDFERYSEVIEGLQKVKAKDSGKREMPEGADAARVNEKEALEQADARAFEYKGCVMSKEEFSEFAEAFDHTIKELCENFKSGEIAARPKRTGDVTACRYCAYKGICRFDITVPGYDYEKIV